MTAPPSAAAPTAGGPHAGEHLDDAALVRWLDGESPSGRDGAFPSDPREAALGAHAAACPVCAARAAVIRRRRVRLSGLLAVTDLPAPSRAPDVALLGRAPTSATADQRGMYGTPPRAFGQRPRVGVRAAVRPAGRGGVPRLAAAGLLVAATLAAQPVRHWVATVWERRTGTTPESGANASGPTRRAQEPHPRATVVVTFTPEPGPFTIRFDARPASGTLTVVAVAGAQASATAHPAPDAATGTGVGDLLVLPTGVRVRNARTAASDYRVTVPATFGRVHVHFDASPGGAAVDTLLELTNRPTVFPLARERR